MKIETQEPLDRPVVITEAYVGPIFRTSEGNEYAISMRDDTVEIGLIGDAPLPLVFDKNGQQIMGLSRED